MESGEDRIVVLGRLDQLSSQMEAAKCALPIGMMELHFLKSFPRKYEPVVQFFLMGDSCRVQIKKAVQGHHACVSEEKQRWCW